MCVCVVVVVVLTSQQGLAFPGLVEMFLWVDSGWSAAWTALVSCCINWSRDCVWITHTHKHIYLRVSQSPGRPWSWICFVVEDDLELLLLLPSPAYAEISSLSHRAGAVSVCMSMYGSSFYYWCQIFSPSSVPLKSKLNPYSTFSLEILWPALEVISPGSCGPGSVRPFIGW